MEVTVDNWKSVERDLKEFGVQDVVYDEEGIPKTIVSTSGTSYELSHDTIKNLIKSGLVEVKLGRRAGDH